MREGNREGVDRGEGVGSGIFLEFFQDGIYCIKRKEDYSIKSERRSFLEGCAGLSASPSDGGEEEGEGEETTHPCNINPLRRTARFRRAINKPHGCVHDAFPLGCWAPLVYNFVFLLSRGCDFCGILDGGINNFLKNIWNDTKRFWGSGRGFWRWCWFWRSLCFWREETK